MQRVWNFILKNSHHKIRGDDHPKSPQIIIYKGVRMKRTIFILIFMITFFIGNVNASISENFSKMLEMMKIPQTNPDGYIINEAMYDKYNLIVYGKPQDVIKNQRWKDVSNGKWINESTGKRR